MADSQIGFSIPREYGELIEQLKEKDVRFIGKKTNTIARMIIEEYLQQKLDAQKIREVLERRDAPAGVNRMPSLADSKSGTLRPGTTMSREGFEPLNQTSETVYYGIIPGTIAAAAVGGVYDFKQ